MSIREIYFHYDLFFTSLTEMGINLNSIVEITEIDCLALQSFLIQVKHTAPSSIKKLIHMMSHFYDCIVRKKGIRTKNPFNVMTIPTTEQITNPVEPIPVEMMLYIEEHLHLVPVVVRMIYKCSKITGARSSSIFDLTTDDLFFQNGKMVIRVINFKTEKRDVKSGHSSEVRHVADDEFAKELLDYIKASEHVRKRLEKPFLFVVNEPTHTRYAGNLRCTPTYFRAKMNLIMQDAPFKRRNGTKFWFSFRARNTLNKPHYNEFLEKEFVEFQKSEVASSYEELLIKIEKLQAALSKKNSKIRTLNMEIETEKKRRLDVEEKYRFLLGEYQSRVKANIIQF